MSILDELGAKGVSGETVKVANSSQTLTHR
jgi:hypothetical protein